jgi:hypothetical protein
MALSHKEIKMFIIKNTQTCGGKVRAGDFQSESEAKTYAVNHLLTSQNLADYSEDGEWDIENTMRRCGLEIIEVTNA